MADRKDLLGQLINIEAEVKRLEKSKMALEEAINTKQKQLLAVEEASENNIKLREEAISKKEFEASRKIEEDFEKIEAQKKELALKAEEYSVFEHELKSLGVAKQLFEDEKKLVEQQRISAIEAERRATLVIDQYTQKIAELEKQDLISKGVIKESK